MLLDLPKHRGLGWRFAVARLRAWTPAGEVDLAATIADGLLTRLAPGLDEVVVREVPWRPIFAGRFVGTVGCAREAATIGIPMLC